MSYKVFTEDQFNSMDLSEIAIGLKRKNLSSLLEAKLMYKDGVRFPFIDRDDVDSIMRIWGNVKMQMIYGLYKKVPTYFDMPKLFFMNPTKDPEDEVIKSRFLTSIRKIRKREGNKKYMCRFEVEDIKLHQEAELIPVDPDTPKPKEYFVVIRSSVETHQLYRIYCLYVNLANNTITPVKNGVFYIGNADDALTALDNGDLPLITGEMDIHLLRILSAPFIIDADVYEKSEFKVPNYSPNELKSIFSVYQNLTHHASVHSINIERNDIINTEDISDDMVEHLVENSIHIDSIYPDANRSDWPIIKFTDREWKAVFKYIENEYYKTGKVYSLLAVLKDPRYGFNYRMPVDGHEVNITYNITDGGNIIFYLSEVLNIHVTAFMQFVVTNTDGKGFIPFTIISIMLDTPNEMKTKELSFYNDSFILTNPADVVMNKVYAEFIAMMVTMHDKPERNKVVSCQTQRRDPTKKQTAHVNPTTGQTTYITHRILSPAASARDYMIKMSRDHKNREAIYVMEEWDRREHTRRLKSGKIVYVKAAHCKRRLELQQPDEIRIKL